MGFLSNLIGIAALGELLKPELDVKSKRGGDYNKLPLTVKQLKRRKAQKASNKARNKQRKYA